MASIDVQKAVGSHFNSRSALTEAIPNGIFAGEAPKGTRPFPYAVHSQISNVPRSRSNCSEFVDHVFQISVFDTTPESAGEKAKVVLDNFDFQRLTADLLDGKVLDLRRQSQLETREDNKVWAGVVTWQALVQKPVNYQPV